MNNPKKMNDVIDTFMEYMAHFESQSVSIADFIKEGLSMEEIMDLVAFSIKNNEPIVFPLSESLFKI